MSRGPTIVALSRAFRHPDAACRDEDAELFWPLKADAPAYEAKAICGRCPAQVRAACLAHALDNDEQHGVWGGLTATERNAWKRRCRACGSTRCKGGEGCDEARAKREMDA